MLSAVFIGIALAGWLIFGRVRVATRIGRIQRPGPFPPYDWFLEEQSPEEVGLVRRASGEDGASR